MSRTYHHRGKTYNCRCEYCMSLKKKQLKTKGVKRYIQKLLKNE